MSTMGERIKKSREERGLYQAQLAEMIGAKSAGVISNWEKDLNKPDADKIVKLCHALGVTASYLLDYHDDLAVEFSAAERQLIKKYRALDAHGKRMIDFALDEETARMAEAESKKAPATKTIPLFGSSFAAGFGEPDFGNAFEHYEVEASSTADFAIRINGDSMEPYLPDGSIALGVQRLPADGEVAALLVDGNFLVKQVCQDILGNLYLFALNRDRKDTDLEIKSDSGRSVQCFGTILLKNLPQLPVAIGG